MLGVSYGSRGAFDAVAAAVQDVSVDHGRFYAFMAEKLLYSSDIVTVLKQMSPLKINHIKVSLQSVFYIAFSHT